MKRFASQLKKQAETVKLSAFERDDLRDRLQSYMEYHPLSQTVTKKKAEVYIAAESYKLISIPKLYLKAAVGLFAVLIIIGVPLGAERAVPGDSLYFVKVQFNEEVRSTLALSPYEKVEWEAERLSRRISEARLLASEGKLTDEFETEVAQAVRAHSDAAQKEIASLRESDAEGAAIAEIVFASALDVQSVLLKAESDKASTTNNRSSNEIATAVEEKRNEANANQVVSEEVPSVSRLQARIEIETTRAYELLETVRKYATTQEITDIERRLQDVERKLASVLNSEDVTEKEARTLLREALQGTNKLIAFMTDIDVRAGVVIEELVPVELTDEEYKTLVDEKLLFVGSVIVVANGALASTTNESVITKVEGNLLELANLSEQAFTSLATSSYKAALEDATAAETLAEDVLTLLNVTLNQTKPEPKPEIVEEIEAGSTTEEVIEENASTTEDVVEESELETSSTTEEVLGASTTEGVED